MCNDNTLTLHDILVKTLQRIAGNFGGELEFGKLAPVASKLKSANILTHIHIYVRQYGTVTTYKILLMLILGNPPNLIPPSCTTWFL